jgi:hypothetical protein
MAMTHYITVLQLPAQRLPPARLALGGRSGARPRK